jgi:hypothetical protein
VDAQTAKLALPRTVTRERWAARAIWTVLFALPTAVFVVAAMLEPDPRGHSTHTQLGLPPCGFLLVTGLPCPGCGLTTSFAHMIRGQIGGAFDANPFGVLLFSATAVFIALAAVGAIRGLSVLDTLFRVHAEKWMLGLAAISIVVWVAKIAQAWLLLRT